jgi:hypothetical protein
MSLAFYVIKNRIFPTCETHEEWFWKWFSHSRDNINIKTTSPQNKHHMKFYRSLRCLLASSLQHFESAKSKAVRSVTILNVTGILSIFVFYSHLNILWRSFKADHYIVSHFISYTNPFLMIPYSNVSEITILYVKWSRVLEITLFVSLSISLYRSNIDLIDEQLEYQNQDNIFGFHILRW